MEENSNSRLNDEDRQSSPSDQSQLDTTRYDLTVDAASRLFAEAGVPRSPRTVTRFCQLGDLECIRVDTEKYFKWLVDRNSVEKRIKELQQAVHFSKKSYQDMTSHDLPVSETQPVITSHDEHDRETEQPSKKDEWLRDRVEELENENIHLKIDKAAKEQVINQMNTERREFITQLNDMSFRLGETTAKLQQLEAPRPQPATSHSTSDGEQVTREAETVQYDPTPEQPAASTPEKRGFFGRLFG